MDEHLVYPTLISPSNPFRRPVQLILGIKNGLIHFSIDYLITQIIHFHMSQLTVLKRKKQL